MPLDKLIKMSKQVTEPCLWANRMLSIGLLMSIAMNAILLITLLSQ
jgi:hypothetical protein